MKSRKFLVLAGIPFTAAAIVLSGCGRSESVAEKNVPADIRGEPINVSKPGVTTGMQPDKKQAPTVVEAKPITSAPIESKPAASLESKTTPTPTPAPVVATPEKKGDYLTVGFDKLASYNFDVPNDDPVTNAPAGPDKADEQIPASVKAFNQKKVSIKGFMLPLKVDSGVVTEFLIMKDQSMCCYGNVPKITEWVSVKTTGKGMKAIMDQPVNIEGTLHVGAMRENGYLVGIYGMDGEKLVESGE
jgi:hypothetical protein